MVALRKKKKSEIFFTGHAVAQLLRHFATRRKVTGSIPDGVIGIFHWHNPSCRTISLGLTQPPTEMSTRNISLRGRGGRCVWLTTLPPSCADCLKIWDLHLPRILLAYPGLYRNCFTFTFTVYVFLYTVGHSLLITTHICSSHGC